MRVGQRGMRPKRRRVWHVMFFGVWQSLAENALRKLGTLAYLQQLRLLENLRANQDNQHHHPVVSQVRELFPHVQLVLL